MSNLIFAFWKNIFFLFHRDQRIHVNQIETKEGMFLQILH